MDYLRELPGKINFQYLKEVSELQSDIWDKGHGPRFKSVLNDLSEVRPSDISYSNGAVNFSGDAPDNLETLLMELKSWRKGPFQVNGIEIEAEWRSDKKWDRLFPALPELKDKVVLDIGANNGYFMFRMDEHKPKLVMGLEPTLIYKAQFDTLKKFYPKESLQLETSGVEHLSAFESVFDVIFSMGILYHHRSPLDQLKDMRAALKPGGCLVLETIGIPGEDAFAITPTDRYAGMRNVWLLPTLSQLQIWLERSKFVNVEIVSENWDGVEEQRATKWSGDVSYQDFLNADDPSLTREGLPAPKRFLLKASRK